MPTEHYQRPRGLVSGVDRTFKLVAVPWLETGKRALNALEAEFVVCVCHHPHALANPVFGFHPRLASLIERAPADVGELIRRVGKWRAKQSRTKLGRARHVIERAMTMHPDKPLGIDLLMRIAKAEKINLCDVSPDYLRGRVNDVRAELEKLSAGIPPATPEEIAALIAAQDQGANPYLALAAIRSKQTQKVNAR